MSGTETASYVYAITRPFDPAGLLPLHGVGEAPVHIVARDSLAAVVSAVPRAEFEEEALQEALSDWDRLAALVQAHHAVVDTLARHTAVMPLRLATVYHDDERVRAALHDEGPRFEALLRRLDGCVEWGVKLHTDPAAAPDSGRGPEAPAASGGPGRAYLDRRRTQRRHREDLWRGAAEFAERIDEDLRGIAEAGRRHRPQDPRLSGASDENVLNGAYLVAQERSDGFLAAVARWRDRSPEGTRMEVSGPWAPYSFVEPGEEAAVSRQRQPEPS